eukprot:SM000021S06487  [mRNA]  locus=s21:608211:609125:+ [translate_table: standard]
MDTLILSLGCCLGVHLMRATVRFASPSWNAFSGLRVGIREELLAQHDASVAAAAAERRASQVAPLQDRAASVCRAPRFEHAGELSWAVQVLDALVLAPDPPPLNELSLALVVGLLCTAGGCDHGCRSPPQGPAEQPALSCVRPLAHSHRAPAGANFSKGDEVDFRASEQEGLWPSPVAAALGAGTDQSGALLIRHRTVERQRSRRSRSAGHPGSSPRVGALAVDIRIAFYCVESCSAEELLEAFPALLPFFRLGYGQPSDLTVL